MMGLQVSWQEKLPNTDNSLRFTHETRRGVVVGYIANPQGLPDAIIWWGTQLICKSIDRLHVPPQAIP